MADVDFRDKFPYHSNTENDPLIITSQYPTFTTLNLLEITDNLPAGKYLLTVIYEWSMADTNDSAIFRLISPLTQGTEYRQEPKDANDNVLRTSAMEFDWIGGAITFDAQACVTAGGQPLTLSFSQLIFERKV